MNIARRMLSRILSTRPSGEQRPFWPTTIFLLGSITMTIFGRAAIDVPVLAGSGLALASAGLGLLLRYWFTTRRHSSSTKAS